MQEIELQSAKKLLEAQLEMERGQVAREQQKSSALERECESLRSQLAVREYRGDHAQQGYGLQNITASLELQNVIAMMRRDGGHCEGGSGRLEASMEVVQLRERLAGVQRQLEGSEAKLTECTTLQRTLQDERKASEALQTEVSKHDSNELLPHPSPNLEVDHLRTQLQELQSCCEASHEAQLQLTQANRELEVELTGAVATRLRLEEELDMLLSTRKSIAAIRELKTKSEQSDVHRAANEELVHELDVHKQGNRNPLITPSP